MPAGNKDFDRQMPTTLWALPRFTLSPFPAPRGIRLQMTPRESRLLKRTLRRNRGRAYMEFGAGGSTLLAATLLPEVVSVENDVVFTDFLRDRLKGLATKCAPKFVAVDQGPLREWGFPETSDPSTLHRYAEAPWTEAAVPRDLGVVLIDGRFRRSCLLRCWLRLPDDVVFLLHDASRYEDVVNLFFLEEERADELQRLRRRPGVSAADVQNHLDEVLLNPQ